jgi:hypothetical protein
MRMDTKRFNPQKTSIATRAHLVAHSLHLSIPGVF